MIDKENTIYIFQFILMHLTFFKPQQTPDKHCKKSKSNDQIIVIMLHINLLHRVASKDL